MLWFSLLFLNFLRKGRFFYKTEMAFKKGDKVTTPSGGGMVYQDQEADKVQILITATDKVETFDEENVEADTSPGNTREVWD